MFFLFPSRTSVPPIPGNFKPNFLAAVIASPQLIPYLNLLLGFFSIFFQSTTVGSNLSITFNKRRPSLASSYKLFTCKSSIFKLLIQNLNCLSSLVPSISSQVYFTASYSSAVNSSKPCFVLKI